MLRIVSLRARSGGDATYCRKISQGENTKKTCFPTSTVTNNDQLPEYSQVSASKWKLKYHFCVETDPRCPKLEDSNS